MTALNHDAYEAEQLVLSLDYINFIEEQQGPGSFGQALAFAREISFVVGLGFSHLLSDYAKSFTIQLRNS